MGEEREEYELRSEMGRFEVDFGSARLDGMVYHRSNHPPARYLSSERCFYLFLSKSSPISFLHHHAAHATPQLGRLTIPQVGREDMCTDWDGLCGSVFVSSPVWHRCTPRSPLLSDLHPNIPLLTP